VFTTNATGALKLVGESYPFSPQSSYVLSADSHNSLNGIRRFACAAGAEVHYLAACPQGGFDEAEMEVRSSFHENIHCPLFTSPTFQSVLAPQRPATPSAHCLFGVTGQSNVSGHRVNLKRVVPFAKQQGFDVLLDAAALAPSSRISLRQLNGGVDAMAISFYKMFGYPTGVGALVARKDFLAKLRRPYFAGGTVELVQVPGTVIQESMHEHERFEVRSSQTAEKYSLS
jgi:molybdenum cofactor sulfurtransferase